jgi:hypothetical protein
VGVSGHWRRGDLQINMFCERGTKLQGWSSLWREDSRSVDLEGRDGSLHWCPSQFWGASTHRGNDVRCCSKLRSANARHKGLVSALDLRPTTPKRPLHRVACLGSAAESVENPSVESGSSRALRTGRTRRVSHKTFE